MGGDFSSELLGKRGLLCCASSGSVSYTRQLHLKASKKKIRWLYVQISKDNIYPLLITWQYWIINRHLWLILSFCIIVPFNFTFPIFLLSSSFVHICPFFFTPPPPHNKIAIELHERQNTAWAKRWKMDKIGDARMKTWHITRGNIFFNLEVGRGV